MTAMAPRMSNGNGSNLEPVRPEVDGKPAALAGIRPAMLDEEGRHQGAYTLFRMEGR